MAGATAAPGDTRNSRDPAARAAGVAALSAAFGNRVVTSGRGGIFIPGLPVGLVSGLVGGASLKVDDFWTIAEASV